MDHDPVEDIVCNDEEDDGVGPAYSVYDYWFDKQYIEFESYMEWIKQEIYLDRIYGPLEAAADDYYEELERLEAIADAAPHNPMTKLEMFAKEAEKYGCHMDKHFYYEAMDIMAEDSADDHFGDGDPEQWNY